MAWSWRNLAAEFSRIFPFTTCRRCLKKSTRQAQRARTSAGSKGGSLKVSNHATTFHSATHWLTIWKRNLTRNSIFPAALKLKPSHYFPLSQKATRKERSQKSGRASSPSTSGTAAPNPEEAQPVRKSTRIPQRRYAIIFFTILLTNKRWLLFLNGEQS
jgi:hypothetical protein